jgi:hypothetical protein
MRKFIYIFFSLILTSGLYSQEILSNVFTEKLGPDILSKKEKSEIRNATRKIIKKYEIDFDKYSDCWEYKNSLNFKKIEDDLQTLLTDKMERWKINHFLNRSFNNYDFCSFILYFIPEENGLSMKENIERNALIEKYQIYSMSEDGKLAFFKNYRAVNDSLYQFESVLSKNCLRIDTIWQRSLRFFHEILSEEDGNILDFYWQSRWEWLVNLHAERDSIHKGRLIQLRKSIDGLESLYLPSLMIERDSLMGILNEKDLECIKRLSDQYVKSINSKREFNWDATIKYYPEQLPNFADGLAYIYNLLKKYPSTMYASSNWRFNSVCRINPSIKREDFKYIQFEKALSEAIDIHYPNIGMIYYSPYSRYTHEDIMKSNDNMYLFYFKSN